MPPKGTRAQVQGPGSSANSRQRSALTPGEGCPDGPPARPRRRACTVGGAAVNLAPKCLF
eukprot:6992006-Pyramimonas_sp.AAC.1